MKMSEAFSLPLQICAIHEEDYSEDCNRYICDSMGDVLIPSIPDDVDQESIVEAVNNHDSMTEKITKLLGALCDIQGMCIGNIAMGYKLDADSIGMMIYETTGLTHPELLAKLNQVTEKEDGL
ncbi:hypothetical protein VPHD164_0029 [Vibrio phage D164]